MASSDALLIHKIKNSEPFRDFLAKHGNEGLKMVLSYVFILGYEQTENIFYTTPFANIESLLKTKQTAKNVRFLGFYIKNRAVVRKKGELSELSVYLKSLKEAGFRRNEIFYLFLGKYGKFNVKITEEDLSFCQNNVKGSFFEDSFIFSTLLYSYLLNDKNSGSRIPDIINDKYPLFRELSDFDNILSKQAFFYRNVKIGIGKNGDFYPRFSENPSFIFSTEAIGNAIKKLEKLKNTNLVSPFVLNILFPSIVKILDIYVRLEKEEHIEKILNFFVKAAEDADLKHLTKYLNGSHSYCPFFEKDSFLFLSVAETLFSESVLKILSKREKFFDSFLSSFGVFMSAEIKRFYNLKTEITFLKTESEYEKINHIINKFRFGDIYKKHKNTKEYSYMLKRTSLKMENVLKQSGFNILYNAVKQEGNFTPKESLRILKTFGLNPSKKISVDKKRIIKITPYLKYDELSIEDAIPLLKGFLKTPDKEYETADFKEEEIFLINLKKKNTLTSKALEVLKKNVDRKSAEKKFSDV